MPDWGALPDVLDRACMYYATRTAIEDGDRHLTYRDLQGWTNRVANGLASLGVVKGERVGLLMTNSLEFIPTQHGIWKSGASFVQLPTRASARDLAYFLEQSAATTLIYDAHFEGTVDQIRSHAPGVVRLIRAGEGPTDPAVLDYRLFDEMPSTRPNESVSPADEAYVAFTSGTTGTPKGVVYTHHAWSQNIVTAGLEIAQTRPGERFAFGAPLTHYSGAFVLPTFMRGGTSVMLPGLEVETLLTAIEEKRITATAVVPTIIYLLLDHPRLEEFDLRSLSTVVYAGSPISPERLREALSRFGPIFVQAYAGHEPGFLSVLRKEDHVLAQGEDPKRLSSAGRPFFHVQVSIQSDADQMLSPGEVGEICGRQEGQMIGYLDSERNREALRDGWVHSGDLGYFDDAGFLYLVDRKKEMIVSGGFNVFPRQVEDALQEHPAVAQCAVFGVPDAKWGEAVKAAVALRPGHDVTASDLIAFVKERKGAIAAPKTIDFMAELPLNPSGKVDKPRLRAPYWREHSRAIG